VADVMAAAPARIFGLPGKGRIEPGYDADFVVCDTAGEWVFRKEDCASNSRDSYVMYDGRHFKGVIDMVFNRGRVVASGGSATSSRNGRFITPR
jgi:dihydroorotase-like cyclic amidohydrolase